MWQLIYTAAASALLVLGARRCGETFARPARIALAVVIAAGFVTEQVVYAARGIWSDEVNLPLQLSDAVTFVSVAALLRPDRIVMDLVPTGGRDLGGRSEWAALLHTTRAPLPFPSQRTVESSLLRSSTR